jgi:hypothetical protein
LTPTTASNAEQASEEAGPARLVLVPSDSLRGAFRDARIRSESGSRVPVKAIPERDRAHPAATVTDDPDAALERAVGAGATVMSPVANEHGWRLGRMVDPFGHDWEIGKPIGAWPPT